MADDKIKHLADLKKPDAPTSEHDRLYGDRRELVTDFRFDRETAAVFDDMVGRSVPFYGEIQRMVGEIAADFAAPGTNLYDLGCATGTTLAALDPVVDPSVRFVGVDNAAEMLEKARRKLAQLGSRRVFDLVEADLHRFHAIEDASVVTLILTLQFVRPLYRRSALESICRSLRPGGCLILVEKLTFSDSTINRLFIRHYYDFKRRNGYSDIEIAQKREALENVLIPYRFDENRQMLLDVGFREVEEFFRWYNFCGLLATK